MKNYIKPRVRKVQMDERGILVGSAQSAQQKPTPYRGQIGTHQIVVLDPELSKGIDGLIDDGFSLIERVTNWDD